ncbi:MAG: hypothetical protein WD795_08300 [Woeseia sp.]
MGGIEPSDNREASPEPWTIEVWYYDYRTNVHHTLKKKPMRVGANGTGSFAITASTTPLSDLAVPSEYGAHLSDFRNIYIPE